MSAKCIVSLFILLATSVLAQNSTSPYSTIGLGEQSGVDHFVYSGIGGNRINYVSPTVLNSYNPASYSFIKPQYPVFSAGLSSRFSTFESNGATQKNATTALSELAFGVSFAKRFGLAFGLKPYSKRGYSFSQTFPVSTDSIRHEYLGSGDVNRAFLGLSVTILDLDTFQLKWSVGANLSSLFGTVKNERRSYLLATTSTAGGIEYNSTRIKTFHYELGTIITKKFNGGHLVTLAATYQPEQQLTAYQNTQLFLTTLDIANPNTYILTSQTGEAKGKVIIAPNLTIGGAYSFSLRDKARNNKTRNSELSVFASYNTTDWSKFSTAFRDTLVNPGYKSTSSINIGIQYRPETDLLANSVAPKFFERMTYRAGYYTKTLPYVFNGTQLNEFGTSFGLGLPILADKTESSIQLGVTYGKRGTNQTGSLNETFVGFNIGFIIAPSNADKWFVKRKLD